MEPDLVSSSNFGITLIEFTTMYEKSEAANIDVVY